MSYFLRHKHRYCSGVYRHCSGVYRHCKGVYMDFILSSYAISVSSYICGTTDFLKQIYSIDSFLDNPILATMDIVDLYTNILQKKWTTNHEEYHL